MNKTEQRFEAAKAAMAAIINADHINTDAMSATQGIAVINGCTAAETTARCAIEYADALLAELARTESVVKESFTPDADGWVVRIPTDPIPERHNGVRFADGWECDDPCIKWVSWRWHHGGTEKREFITHYRPA